MTAGVVDVLAEGLDRCSDGFNLDNEWVAGCCCGHNAPVGTSDKDGWHLAHVAAVVEAHYAVTADERHVDVTCPTCSGPSRETVDMVCRTCLTDYAPGPRRWAEGYEAGRAELAAAVEALADEWANATCTCGGIAACLPCQYADRVLTLVAPDHGGALAVRTKNPLKGSDSWTNPSADADTRSESTPGLTVTAPSGGVTPKFSTPVSAAVEGSGTAPRSKTAARDAETARRVLTEAADDLDQFDHADVKTVVDFLRARAAAVGGESS